MKKIFDQPVLKVVRINNDIIATSDTPKSGFGSGDFNGSMGTQGRMAWDDDEF